MPFVPDQPRKSRFVPDQAPYDPMNDAPRLPGEAGFDDPNIRPLSEAYDTFGKRAARFGRDVNAAAGELNRAEGSPLVGALDAAGSVVRGVVAAPAGAIVGTIKGGSPEEEARIADEFVRKYASPFTEQGRAQIGMLGALTSPLTESGTDVALGPLFAAESRALASGPAKIPSNARRTAPGRSDVPAQPGTMARTDAAGEASAAPSAPAKRSSKLGGVSQEPPTIEELGQQASAAYKRAEDAGVKVSQASFTSLKTKLAAAMSKEGIDPTLHPSTSAAIKRINDSKGAQTLEQLESLRRIANDAKKSTAPADQRLAMILVDEFDDYIAGIDQKDLATGLFGEIGVSGNAAEATAALREARNLYTRKMKAEEIRQLIERAELSAPNFSASGMENALRTEFRALAKNKNKMRRFSAEEQAAIRRVAKGGPVENAFRFIGKFAPTGVVSGTLAGGLAAAVFGPAGAAVPLAGLGGRTVATRMTTRNARRAEELMRRGPNALATTEPKRNKLAEPLDY